MATTPTKTPTKTPTSPPSASWTNATTTTKAAPASAPPAKKEEMPTRVTLVPDDNLTQAERDSAAESNAPDAVENRNKSYLPPVEGVNQNDPEAK